MNTPRKRGRPTRAVAPAPAAGLRAARRRVDRAAARLATAQAERDAAVRTALAAGWTHAAIAAELGVSRGRINQIARG
jgi:DNA-binding NarL/FixJ family response regulator